MPFVLLDVIRERMVTAMRLLPGPVSGEDGCMRYVTAEIVDPLVLGEGAVVAVVPNREQRHSPHAHQPVPAERLEFVLESCGRHLQK